jgi:hypothetical protein
MIVSAYLTSGVDLQRGIIQAKDDPQYISAWYDSVIRSELDGVILHDGLSDSFIRQFPKVKFIRIAECGKFLLYDYRWLAFKSFLENNECDNVFFTDVSDVRAVKNPFKEPEYDSGKLYCGDVNGDVMRGDYWIGAALKNKKLMALPGFEEIITSDRLLLNCGTFGGGREIVLKFLNVLCDTILSVADREPDITVDIPVFNYVMYIYFSSLLYAGWPVNSGFKKYENRNDVWFIHK